MASYVQLGQSGKVYRNPSPGKKPPKKKKWGTQFAYVFLALLLVMGIGLMVGATLWLTSGNPADDNSHADENSIDVRYTGTRSSGTHPTVPPTTTTTVSTTAPTTTTTVVYVPNTRGSFMSENDYKVKLIAEYGVVQNESGQPELQLQVYLQSFSLQMGARKGTITVNGKEYSFRSEEIIVEENVRTKTLLATQVLDTSEKELRVDVTWNMNVTYSGVEIDELHASGVITLP